MTNNTQYVVCSIRGAEELLNKSEEVFHKKESTISFIENGFQVHVEGLPYYFQLSCFDEIGWNVFLTSINGIIEDHEETDSYYHQLEDAVDLVNAQYFGEDMDEERIAYRFFKLKSITTEKMSQLKEVTEIKDTGKFVLKVAFRQLQNFPLEFGYSKVFKRWYYEFNNPEMKEILFKNESFRQCAEELDYLIGNFNHSM